MVPGDKSISHRALILAGLAQGTSCITGLLEGEDVLRTAAALRVLGVEIERDNGRWQVTGAPWQTPARTLYAGNAGTGARLLMGAVAGQGIEARFDGDASLRRRPMGRILAPLGQMGLAASATDGCLPVKIAAGAQASKPLKAIHYRLPTPSAQVKSAILLAGLGATGETIIEEPVLCRDHTEKMLEAFGVKLTITAMGNSGRQIAMAGGQKLRATEIAVPGDPSSAAFPVVAALLVPGSDIVVEGVLMNPQRIGLFETLHEMGGHLDWRNMRVEGGEQVADIHVRHSTLAGVTVPAERAASMIDEYPILAIAAAFAQGETTMAGLAELRVKESDRLAAMEAGLLANGIACRTGTDWLSVTGKGADAGAIYGGGHVQTHDDHRIAMSFLTLGFACQQQVHIDSAEMIATSFPGFMALLEGLTHKT